LAYTALYIMVSETLINYVKVVKPQILKVALCPIGKCAKAVS